jgi:hypothetical protein
LGLSWAEVKFHRLTAREREPSRESSDPAKEDRSGQRNPTMWIDRNDVSGSLS